MKIGIYDQYLDTLGGGERYILTLARYLSENNDVSLFWDDEKIKQQIEKKLSIDIEKVRFVKNIFSKDNSLIQKIKSTSKFDLIIFVSDGSIPILFSKKSFLLLQYPVNWTNPKSIMSRIKLLKISGIICYSEFVKSFIDKTFPINCVVIAPPVEKISGKYQKENIILSVGRFTKAINNKKQEVMIEVFKEMIQKGLKNWKLVIVGSALPNDSDLVVKLRKMSVNYPIEIHENVQYSDLSSFYAKAKIYWHAAGFGENLDKHPERAEHFGITTVEAMSTGAVPVVINAGGQKEIVKDGENGYLWSTKEELKNLTIKLIEDEELMKTLSTQSEKRAADFSYESFGQKVKELIS